MFTKMHGYGDDFIIVDSINQTISSDVRDLAKKYCDRHCGVGANGLVIIGESQMADIHMRKINVDGSDEKMCGNATRCVARYVYENGLCDKSMITIETISGIKQAELHIFDGIVQQVTVNMDEPIWVPDQIPVISKSDTMARDESIYIEGTEYTYTAVSIGNPHAVLFIDAVEEVPIYEIGPKIECHPNFPDRANVEFVEIIDRHNIKVRVSERAVGPTLACGTGACAAVVTSVVHGYTDRNVAVHMPGGTLQIYWDEASNCVFMTGKAEVVFSGVISELDDQLSVDKAMVKELQ